MKKFILAIAFVFGITAFMSAKTYRITAPSNSSTYTKSFVIKNYEVDGLEILPPQGYEIIDISITPFNFQSTERTGYVVIQNEVKTYLYTVLLKRVCK